MTFSDAIDEINHSYDYSIDKYTVIDVLEELRKEYEPKEGNL